MGIQINGQNDEIRATDGSGTVHLDVVGNVTSSSTSTFSNGLNVTGGNVGIGTDNPNAAKLDVRGSNNPLLKLTQTTSGIARLNIESETNDGYQYAGIGIGTASADAELMWTTLGFDVNVADSVRLRIPSSGDVQVLTGNLVIGTSGKGIDFSAASPSAAGSSSAVLDDYEEGTFTPTDVGGGGLTFTTALGHYVKIGNIVNVQIRVKWPTTSNTSSARVSLPFTGFNPSGANVSDGATAGAAGYISGGSVIPQIHTSGSSAEIYFYNFGGQMNNSNFSGLELRFGIVYRTS